ncbi:hypothetical protein [Pseudomonas sp. NFX15]|uniref:hypothetical protein n=1 Tax=Pseudomonas sp. NFX15 TaxID=2816958 RepID=UPI003B9E78A9
MTINSTSNPVIESGPVLTGSKPTTTILGGNTGISQRTSQAPVGREASTTVSTMANQLSEASLRAQARDARLTRVELESLARKTVNELTSPYYTANKLTHDTEVPDTNDPTLLARAEKATSYTRGLASNPFSGMSMDQLALITYDDSGTFTVNERRAALEESDKQEFAWRQKVVAQAEHEYNTTGKLTKFFQSVLDHYKDLPQIQQAEYPSDYESRLNELIALDFNYLTHVAEGKNKIDIESFILKILNHDSNLPDNERLPSKQPQPSERS